MKDIKQYLKLKNSNTQNCLLFWTFF